MIKNYDISWAGHHLKLGARTCIMGILNVTPDSFSDGGKFFTFDRAVSQAEKMVADGADILDVGGESTRPFSDAVTEAEETRRVVPVIEAIARRVSVPISIDTTKAAVARRAIEAGAAIINDVGALRTDPDMAKVAAVSGVPVILMHMLGTPKTMQVAPAYENLLSEIRAFLAATIDHAVSQGVLRSRIIIDPGIGFGKTIHHNLTLIHSLNAFSSLEVPILIGPSRKSFIRNLLKTTDPHGLDPDLESIETGTQAIVAAGILNGAHIVRVHDVARTVTTVRLMDAMKGIPDASCD
jgi:dihydropteroate synthase